MSVSVSVGYVLFLSSRPSSILAAKSKSSPSQVESGRAIPRGPNLPIGLLPLRTQYPFLHTIKANLTPPAFPFPSIKGPSLG